MRALAVVAPILIVAACAGPVGTLGLVSADSDIVGLKLLRPGVTGRSCRSTIAGVPLAPGAPTMNEALAEILALDTEGNVVTNADVRWRGLTTGLYNRSCIEVRGDLARVVSTVLLPAPPGHEGHHPE